MNKQYIQKLGLSLESARENSAIFRLLNIPFYIWYIGAIWNKELSVFISLKANCAGSATWYSLCKHQQLINCIMHVDHIVH